MPRGPRLDAPGTLHHVMVRGIERRPIFRDDQYWGTLHPDDPCEPLPFAMPRGLRLDALPLFVRNLRSRSSSGIFGPALRAGSSTGVLHHVMVRGIARRAPE